MCVASVVVLHSTHVVPISWRFQMLPSATVGQSAVIDRPQTFHSFSAADVLTGSGRKTRELLMALIKALCRRNRSLINVITNANVFLLLEKSSTIGWTHWLILFVRVVRMRVDFFYCYFYDLKGQQHQYFGSHLSPPKFVFRLACIRPSNSSKPNSFPNMTFGRRVRHLIWLAKQARPEKT